MYSNETIKKVMETANILKERYIVKTADEILISISKGNRKIGRVMNVSLMPIMTCANCKECMHYCYDIKACLQYPQNVLDARVRNTVLVMIDINEYFKRIDEACTKRRKNKFFRWHVAGDIISAEYFEKMLEIARKHPDFIFWTYTKKL